MGFRTAVLSANSFLFPTVAFLDEDPHLLAFSMGSRCQGCHQFRPFSSWDSHILCPSCRTCNKADPCAVCLSHSPDQWSILEKNGPRTGTYVRPEERRRYSTQRAIRQQCLSPSGRPCHHLLFRDQSLHFGVRLCLQLQARRQSLSPSGKLCQPPTRTGPRGRSRPRRTAIHHIGQIDLRLRNARRDGPRPSSLSDRRQARR